MELGAAAQIVAFAVFSFVAVAGALGMTTTMSMFRSAIFLMASFIGVAGLFILLMADLLGLLQVMMYIGGMLVMALFMVLFSNDPGGAMMTGMMELPLLEKFFSFGLAQSHMDGHEEHSHDHEDGEGHEHHEGTHGEDGENSGKHNGDNGSGEEEDGNGEMDMEPMFIVQNKKPAVALAAVVCLFFSLLILFRPAWPIQNALPAQNSAEQIGDLLMGKYMIAFEGAGLLILLGIFGAVYLSRPGRYPDPTDRDEIQAAVEEMPAAIEDDKMEPENTSPHAREEERQRDQYGEDRP